MNKTAKWVIGVVIVVISFLANPHGPLGGFWRPDSMAPEPSSLQLPFFLILNVLESITFAAAVVLLIFNFPKKAFAPLSLTQTRLAFVSLIWFLGNWWAHDSLHMHIGMNLQSLLYLEYFFHVSMMLVAAYLLWAANMLWKAKGK